MWAATGSTLLFTLDEYVPFLGPLFRTGCFFGTESFKKSVKVGFERSKFLVRPIFSKNSNSMMLVN